MWEVEDLPDEFGGGCVEDPLVVEETADSFVGIYDLGAEFLARVEEFGP